jgi:hypothetical protein
MFSRAHGMHLTLARRGSSPLMGPWEVQECLGLDPAILKGPHPGLIQTRYLLLRAQVLPWNSGGLPWGTCVNRKASGALQGLLWSQMAHAQFEEMNGCGNTVNMANMFFPEYAREDGGIGCICQMCGSPKGDSLGLQLACCLIGRTKIYA